MRLVRPCLGLLSLASIASACALLASGCADVLGLGTYGEGGQTSTSGAGGSTSTGGVAGSTTSGGTGGSTASGGAGGGTGPGCAQGATQACYTGPAGTEGIGLCHAGVSTCAAGEWGPCTGEVGPVIEKCTTPMADESCDQIASCTGQLRWAKAFGDKVAPAPGGIAADANGDVFLAAGVETTLDLGGGVLSSAGSTDVVIAKLAANGGHLWSLIFGNTAADSPGGLAVDASGNVIVAGTFEGSIDFGAVTLTSAGKRDAFVVKLDPNGEVLWAKGYGGTADDTGTAVAVDPASGEVYVTGGYQKEFTVGADTLNAVPDGQDNALLARLDGNTGSPVWTRGFGSAGPQTGKAVAVGASAGLYLALDATGAIGFGCAGVPVGDPAVPDVMLARLDKANAACTWVRRYGDTAVQTATRLVATGENGVVVAGQVLGSVDFGFGSTVGDAAIDAAVWRVDANGTTLWANRTVTSGAQYIWGLAADALGNVVAGGTFSGTFDLSGGQGGSLVSGPGYDRFLTKLDAGGKHVWSHRYPNGGGAILQLGTDGLGRIDLVSSLLGVTDLGGGDLGTAGDPNMKLLVSQLAP